MQSNSLKNALPFPLLTAPADANAGTQHAGQIRQPWLVSPTIDLLFVCGIAPWCFGLLTYFLLGDVLSKPNPSSNEHALTICYIVASLLIGESHQFTSILRYFFGPKPGPKVHWITRLPLQVIWFSLAILLILSGASTMGQFWIVSLLGTILGFPAMVIALPLVSLAANCFPLVLMHHICAQARTIGQIYCGKAGYQLSKAEIRNFAAVSTMLVFAGTCNVALPFSFDNTFIASDAFSIIKMLWNWGSVIGVAYVANQIVQRGIKTMEWLPLPTALLWTNLVLFVLLPPTAMVYVWLFVPVFYHATQHWAVAWSAKQQENVNAAATRSHLKQFLALLLPVQSLTLLVLFIPALFMESSALGVGGKTLSVGWSMLIFYIHYFTDRIVWRPRLKEAT
ncbi:MAG: hypothetical protein K2X77_30765 [Candidatus Obscuribacterales bacterium]|jgi:hypothetical protein|nr:hypothetical protein [Candidatus Obscuribacterales bacterium]